MRKRLLAVVIGLVVVAWLTAGCATTERVKEDVQIKDKIIDQQMIVK